MLTSELLSQRVNNLGESATLKMSQMARDLRAQGHDIISLSLGQPDFDTPEHIKDAAKKALDEGKTKYTPVAGTMELRKAIVEKFKRENGLEYDVNQIVVSNGAKQSIANLCLALLDPGEQCIIFTPYWVSYYEIVRFAGGYPVPVAAGIEDDFKVTPHDFEKAITDKTKLVIFSSPCNPTGSVYTREELEGIAAVLRKYPNIYVVSDEIYEHINFTEKHASFGTIPGMKDRTITVNGMSKGFAMTGWRLGYLGAPTWIAKACAKIQGQFTSGATAFGQAAAAHALSSDLGPTMKMKKAFIERKKLVLDLLAEIPGIETNDPKGAFYIFPDISHFFGTSNGEYTIRDADDFASAILTGAHVGIVTGSAFGNDKCIRLSYAASNEQLIEAMTRMKNFLKDFKAV